MRTMTVEVPDELAEWIERSAAVAGRSHAAEVARVLNAGRRALPPLPDEPARAYPLPPPVDWPADAPNEEDTRMVDEVLIPVWNELRRRQPGVSVPVVRVGGSRRPVGPFTTGDAPGDQP